MLRIAIALLALTILPACTRVSDTRSERPPFTTPPPTLILISIDGARPDYLNRGLTPTLSAISTSGARAERLIPSFPTLTFPNHYTLVTGLHPDHHAVIHNTMRDAARPGETFSLSNEAARDPFWWNDAEPIWVTAENAGIRAATMFWPGSEAPIRGVRPTHWYMFDKALTSLDRVDQVLAWLDEPAPVRARLYTLYFDVVDTAGHRFGPESDEVNATLRDVDHAIARLIAGLEARGVRDTTNLIIVSDHGMSELSDDRIAYLDDKVDASLFTIESGGVCAFIRPKPGHEREVEAALGGTHDHYRVWRKEEIPAEFHFGTHPRIPPLVALADDGWQLTTRAASRLFGPRKGTHGFDPRLPSMAGIFIASGPDIARGARITELHAVDIHPLLLRLLRLPPTTTDGDAAAPAPLLRTK